MPKSPGSWGQDERLSSLSLESNGISDEGAAFLKSRLLSQFTKLVLSNNCITDGGVERLHSSPRLTGLEYLHLFCNNIGDRGAQVLAASTRMYLLKEISLVGCNISEKGPAVLRDRFRDRLAM